MNESVPKGKGLSRRAAMLGALAVSAGAAASVLAERYPEEVDWMLYKDAGDKMETRLTQRYGANFKGLFTAIEETLQHSGGKSKMEKITPHKTFRLRYEVLKNLERSLVVYPKNIFKELKVSDFILADDVLVDGVSTDSLGLHRRNHLTGYRRLVIQTLRGGTHTFDDVVHHEVGHAFTVGHITEIEWAVKVYGSYEEYILRRARLKRMEHMPVTPIPDRSFVSKYSFETYKEDMAEVMRYMYRNPRAVFEQDDVDPLLKKKINVLAAHVENVSRGRMNVQYWRDLADGEINDEAYWDRRKES